jgi:hypothetical protein
MAGVTIYRGVPSRTSSSAACSDVRDIETRDVQIRSLNRDLRPGFILEDVSNADVIHVRSRQDSDVPTCVLKNVQGFNTFDDWPSPDAHLEKVKQQAL